MAAAALFVFQNEVCHYAVVLSGFQYAEEFKAWKEKYGRFYESDEVELRRHITWESNMQFVREHNAHADEIGFTMYRCRSG